MQCKEDQVECDADRLAECDALKLVECDVDRLLECDADRLAECDADRLVEWLVREISRQGRLSYAMRVDKRLVL